jgi:Flp pilus assembly protein TadG
VNKLRRHLAHRLRSERGAAAVEFALVTPLLLALVFGIIEFGRGYSQLNVYTGAAREGARYAAVRCQPDSTTGCTDGLIASNAVSPSLVGYTATNIHESQVCSDATAGTNVTVSFNASIHLGIPFVPGLQNITYTPTIRAVFRCE